MSGMGRSKQLMTMDVFTQHQQHVKLFLLKIMKIFSEHNRTVKAFYLPSRWKRFDIMGASEFKNIKLEQTDSEDMVILYTSSRADVTKKLIFPIHPANNVVFSFYSSLCDAKTRFCNSRWFI